MASKRYHAGIGTHNLRIINIFILNVHKVYLLSVNKSFLNNNNDICPWCRSVQCPVSILHPVLASLASQPKHFWREFRIAPAHSFLTSEYWTIDYHCRLLLLQQWVLSNWLLLQAVIAAVMSTEQLITAAGCHCCRTEFWALDYC